MSRVGQSISNSKTQMTVKDRNTRIGKSRSEGKRMEGVLAIWVEALQMIIQDDLKERKARVLKVEVRVAKV